MDAQKKSELNFVCRRLPNPANSRRDRMTAVYHRRLHRQLDQFGLPQGKRAHTIAGALFLRRGQLRTYIDERIAFYRDHDPKKQENSDAATIGTMKTLKAVLAPDVNTRQTPTDALVAAGMNDVLNSEGYTLAAWRNRLPIEVWILFILIAAACNFLLGFGARRLSPATHVDAGPVFGSLVRRGCMMQGFRATKFA